MTLSVITSSDIEITDIGARFPDTITIDRWSDIGILLERHDRSLRWVVGDWMLYGSEHFGARAAVIADALNLATGTVANVASVCRRVPMERRHAALSFAHHEEVAHLAADEQERLLDLAEKENLSGSLLRQVIREEAQTRRELAAMQDEPQDAGEREEAQRQDDSVGPPRRSVTLVVTGAVDRKVLDAGSDRVAEALRTWLGTKGFDVDVEVA